ncbi:MAG: preprotein translocase subunit SecE [Alphaproteobacteria bacterium]|nr:preprotein translocase subunit SecE [Alphaproteobacteria bacterium]
MPNEQSGVISEKPRGGIGAFVRETRREISKVTWPARKEITVTTILIVVFALMTGVFFLLVDTVLGYAVSKLLGMS